jgi:lysophospholipase L1-like esterase
VYESVDKLIEKMVVGPRKNADLRWINDQLKTIPDVVYVDMYSHLLGTNNELELRYTKEGLHLSLNGYAKVTEVLKPVIEALFNQGLR